MTHKLDDLADALLAAARRAGADAADAMVATGASQVIDVRGGAEPVFALVLRDTSRVDHARADTQQLGEVDIQSVIELIGSQSLRDIVAKTTDVVEKMCIETAVELTSNNRVAAAEMLGLSRQSLYVKLRKYGLLKSGGD
jgi:DNA-binding NtrC family response regulator